MPPSANFHRQHGYLLDPHTAVGVKAALELRDPNRPVVCLATAHPAKFGAAVTRAIGREPALPPALADLESRESRCAVLDADIAMDQGFRGRKRLAMNGTVCDEEGIHD